MAIDKKKKFEKPSMKVIEVKQAGIICASGECPENYYPCPNDCFIE